MKSSVEHTPLLVNLLRLIRNGRSSNYEDHERGPVLFRFGGLEMSDTGPFTLAQLVWENAAWESMQSLERANDGNKTNRSNDISGGGYDKPRVSGQTTIINSSFAGSLHLAVYVDGVQVELWTVEDYRERYTENSIPRNLHEIEELNSLVHIIYYYLRMQAVYGEIVQRCTRSVMLQNINSHHNTINYHNKSMQEIHSLQNRCEYEREELTYKVEVSAINVECENNLLSNNTGVELCVYSESTEYFPHVKSDYHHSEMWAIEDLVRVTVVSDLLWQSHIRDKALVLNTPIALSTESLSEGANKVVSGTEACDALNPCHECSVISLQSTSSLPPPSPPPHNIQTIETCTSEEKHEPEPLSACNCSDYISFTPTNANASNEVMPILSLPSPMISAITKMHCEASSPSFDNRSVSEENVNNDVSNNIENNKSHTGNNNETHPSPHFKPATLSLSSSSLSLSLVTENDKIVDLPSNMNCVPSRENTQNREECVMHTSQPSVRELKNNNANASEYSMLKKEETDVEKLIECMGHVFATQSLLECTTSSNKLSHNCKLPVDTLPLTELREELFSEAQKENTFKSNSYEIASNTAGSTATTLNAPKNEYSSYLSSSNEPLVMSVDDPQRKGSDERLLKLLTLCSSATLQDCNKVTIARLLEYKLPPMFTPLQ